MSFTFPPALIAALLLALVTAAAVYDARFRRIPNWLTAAGVLVGLASNTFLGGGWAGLRFSLAGLMVAFAIYLALYALRATGAGDVKLMAAVGAFVGWENWIAIFLITAVLGGAAAFILAARHRRVRKTLWNVAFILGEMKGGRPAYTGNEELDVRNPQAFRMPHGPVIAVGTAIFLGIGAHGHWSVY